MTANPIMLRPAPKRVSRLAITVCLVFMSARASIKKVKPRTRITKPAIKRIKLYKLKLVIPTKPLIILFNLSDLKEVYHYKKGFRIPLPE